VSVPGIFSPLLFEGSQLIDGGVVANLPIEEAIPDLPVIALSVQMLEMFRDQDLISEFL
jgi:predicted acylesterase/phospholipase RssA